MKSNLVNTYIFFISFIFISCSGIGGESWQYGDFSELPVKHLIKHNNLSKKQFTKKSKLWLAQNFNNANEVIQLEDEEEGIIVVKYLQDYPAFMGMKSVCNVNVTLTFKYENNSEATLDFSRISPRRGCMISKEAVVVTQNRFKAMSIDVEGSL